MNESSYSKLHKLVKEALSKILDKQETERNGVSCEGLMKCLSDKHEFEEIHQSLSQLRRDLTIEDINRASWSLFHEGIASPGDEPEKECPLWRRARQTDLLQASSGEPQRCDRPKEPGEGEEGTRTRFERDRDAIIHSNALRRLAGVTQVISPGEGLVLHNRLTHSIEVAHIAVRLAQRLKKLFLEEDKQRSIRPEETQKHIETLGGLDDSVVEAAALCHDLGHPPFGHIAEKTLNELTRRAGLDDGFEGNAQAFRIVTTLAVRLQSIEGLNFTRATLNAILKYPWFRTVQKKKWGVYKSEEKYFEFARACQLHGRKDWQSLEAQVMDWADDIAYSVSDTEDFYRAGLIPLDRIMASDQAANEFVDAVFKRWKQLEITDRASKGFDRRFELCELRKAFVNLRSFLPILDEPFYEQKGVRASLRKLTSNLVGRYIRGTKLLREPDKGRFLEIKPEHQMEVIMLKELTWQYVIKNSPLAGQQFGQQQIITKLFDMYCDAIDSKDRDDWDILPARGRDARKNSPASLSGPDVARLAADTIAEMTDQQAVLMYQRLTGVSLAGPFDAWAR
jgi:dGTPase